MKNLLFFTVLTLVLIVVSGCDNGLTDNHNGIIPFMSIRSAAFDPVENCVIEEVHQHNGIFYGPHHNNDGHGHHGLLADNVCPDTTCEITSLHQHNGVHFAGHHSTSHGHGNNHH